MRLTGVVSQSGVLNLAAAERLNLSNGAVSNLLGGSSEKYPKRHKYADPDERRAVERFPSTRSTARKMTRSR